MKGLKQQASSPEKAEADASPEKQEAQSVVPGDYNAVGTYTKDTESKELKLAFKVEQGGIITF